MITRSLIYAIDFCSQKLRFIFLVFEFQPSEIIA